MILLEAQALTFTLLIRHSSCWFTPLAAQVLLVSMSAGGALNLRFASNPLIPGLRSGPDRPGTRRMRLRDAHPLHP